jgi:hypothetical protein
LATFARERKSQWRARADVDLGEGVSRPALLAAKVDSPSRSWTVAVVENEHSSTKAGYFRNGSVPDLSILLGTAVKGVTQSLSGRRS